MTPTPDHGRHGGVAPWVLLAMLTGALGACSGEREMAPGRSIQRDSGDMRIVQNAAPQWGAGPRWTVDTVPTFVVDADGATEAEAFQRLLNVYRLGDGTVVVLDVAAPFVRAFGTDGGLRWRAVAQGGGPGEVQRPALLSRIRGDSLIVEDAASGRSLLVAPNGSIAGDLPSRLISPPDDSVTRLVYPALRLLDGSLVGYSPILRRAEMEGTGMVVPRWPTYLISRDGAHVAALGQWPFVTTAQRSAPASVHIVFGAMAAFASTPHGFVYGFPTTDELRIHDTTGTVRTLLRTPGDRRLASADEIARGRAAVASAATNPRRVALQADRLLVDTLPAYGRVVVGTDGVLWRERFDPAAPPTGYGLARADAGAVWDVHDTSGTWLGAVTMPARFYLTDAGPDWVAGIHADGSDVQTPRVYPLRGR